MSKRREFFVTLFLALFSLNSFADTYIWSLTNADTGALKGDYFETPTNWKLSDGTTATEEPGADDDVIIPSGTAAYTVTASKKFTVKSLTVGDNDDASATVTLKLNVKVNGGEFVGDVVEDVVVGAKGQLTHTAVEETAIGKTDYKLNLKAGRDITIKSGGVVNANECGFNGGQGPYPGNQQSGSYRGAAHGGIGNHRYYYEKNDTDRKPYIRAYGSIRNPSEPGSGGASYRGGGVIFLSAEGSLTVNGTISADASTSDNGAGGSIMLKGGSLAGSGKVTVTGGTGGSYKGGGGGRIAIYTAENKQFTSIPFSSNVKALGGLDGRSTCGTIYFQNGEHIDKRGEIIIDNKRTKNPSTASGRYTYLNEKITDIFEPFGKITVKGSISVVVAYAETEGVEAVNLKLANGLSVQAETKNSKGTVTQVKSMLFTRDKKAGIHFVPESGTVFNFSGSIATNYNFVCNAPGATLSFANNASMYISSGGNNVICGEPGNLLKLTSSTDTGSWTLYPRLEAKIDASYLDVSRGKASSSNKITAKDSIGDDFSKENNWEFPAPIKLGDPLTWTGASDTSWVNAGNWVDQYDGKRNPEETDVITIPANCPNYPKLIAEHKVNTLVVEEGASINLSGANITVTNNLTVAGDITRSTVEKLIVAGEGDAVLDFGNREYGDVVITKSGGTIEFPNGLKTKRLKITSSAATTFKMPAGKTIEADVFDVDGTNGDFDNKHLTFASSVPGSYWKLKVNGVMRVRGVNVSDSDASSGREIAAGDFVTGINQNNLNWNFNSESAVEWVGGTDSNWTTPENWLPVGVPGKDAVVSIRPKDANVSVTLSSADLIVPVGGLILGGSSNTATLTCNKAIEVAGSLDVAENTTLVLNSIATNNIVGKDVIVRPSATITHTGPRWGSSQTYGVNLYVKGDMVVEKNAKVNADGKGFATGYGPGRGTGSGDSQTLPSYGGIGQGQEISNSYGSIMCPRSLGSPCASATPGGGQVAITVDGSLIVDGSITSNGGAYGGTGGSIWLTAGALTGSGSIQAKASATKPGDGYYGAAGGRIAIYQTIAETLGFKGGISYAGESSSSKDCSHGTRYYQYAGAQPGGGTIYFNPNVGPGAVLPMAADGNPRTAYSKATVVLEKGTLTLASDVTVYDFNITQTSGTLNLNGHTMRVISRKHKDGKGWTGGNYEERIKGGSIKPGNGGEIIWIGGFSIKVR